jgi:hypothetical protein
LTLKFPLSILFLVAKTAYPESNPQLWKTSLSIFDVEVVAYGVTCIIVFITFLYHAWSKCLFLEYSKEILIS